MAAPLTLDDIRRGVAGHVPERTPELGRAAAVLVPIFERAGRVFVLLTKRTADLSSHAGQISFPGGKRDEGDANPVATALRETREELGLDTSSIEIVGELDDCPTFVTNFVISPVVGILPDGLARSPSAAEIAEVIEAPLDDFLVPGALRVEPNQKGGRSYVLFYYSVAGHIVWGATARILTELFSLLGRPVEIHS